MSDFRTEDLHRAGIKPIAFPVTSCEGRYLLNGKPFGICVTCALQGPAGIEPEAKLMQGNASCINYRPHASGLDVVGGGVGAHAESVGANPDAAQTAKQGAPIGVSPSPSAQKERA